MLSLIHRKPNCEMLQTIECAQTLVITGNRCEKHLGGETFVFSRIHIISLALYTTRGTSDADFT